MSKIINKIASFVMRESGSEHISKNAVSAEYVAQMMYKSPKHSKKIYDIATKVMKRSGGKVLPKHPLVEKKLTNAFIRSFNELDGMVR